MPEIPPPGFFILEELEARDWTQRDLAYVLGVPEGSVNMLTSGKRGISAEMAKKLGEAFDVPAEFFANLQRMFDLANAPEPDPAVSKRAKLQSEYPIREMIKRRWLVSEDTDLLEKELAAFFEVDTVDDIPHMKHAAKKTRYDEINPTQVAWLFRVRQIAKTVVVPAYSEKKLREALPKLRTMMMAPEECRHVPRVLGECGVRFVVVEALPGSKIDGVCFWLGDSPVIGMSLRYDRMDNLWFVLRHEIEHVLSRDGKDAPKIDAELEGENAGTGPAVIDEERRANSAATTFAIPEEEMASFIARKDPYFSERDMLGFAKRMQVDPSIVAGQIRFRTKRWNLFVSYSGKIRQIITQSAVVDGWGNIAPTA